MCRFLLKYLRSQAVYFLSQDFVVIIDRQLVKKKFMREIISQL